MNKIEKISNKIASSFDDDNKINALSQFLFETQNFDKSNDINQINDNTFEVGQKQYLVLTDDQADKIAADNIENTIKECGVNCINGFEHFIKEDYFNQMMRENYQSYAHDIYEEKDNEYGNRLVKECYDNNLIDDDDFEENQEEQINFTLCKVDRSELEEKLTNYFCQQQNSVDWILNIYGYYPSHEQHDKINLYDDYPNCFDITSCIQFVIASDGRGQQISSYDGVENEVNYNGEYFYIYRIN